MAAQAPRHVLYAIVLFALTKETLQFFREAGAECGKKSLANMTARGETKAGEAGGRGPRA